MNPDHCFQSSKNQKMTHSSKELRFLIKMMGPMAPSNVNPDMDNTPPHPMGDPMPEDDNRQMALPFEQHRRRTYKGRKAYVSDQFPMVRGHIAAQALCASLMRDERGAIDAVSNRDIENLLVEAGFGSRPKSGISGTTSQAVDMGALVRVRRKQRNPDTDCAWGMVTVPGEAHRIEREDRNIANQLREVMHLPDDRFVVMYDFTREFGPDAYLDAMTLEVGDMGDNLDAMSDDIRANVQLAYMLGGLGDTYGWPRLDEIVFTLDIDPQAFDRVAPISQKDRP